MLIISKHSDVNSNTLHTLSRTRSQLIKNIVSCVLAILLSAGLSLSLNGCASQPAASSNDTTKPASAAPQIGGNLNVALDSDPLFLDPTRAGMTAAFVVNRELYDSLIDQDSETNEFVPWLASSFEVNDDATEFKFVLRDDVTFSDGEKLTAQVVKDNFDGIVALGQVSVFGSAYVQNYASTDVIDDHTLVVKFSAPNAVFLVGVASTTFGILSPKTLELTPEERAQGQGVSGTGPFVLESYTPNQSVVLSAREDYNWPSDLRKHSGRAYLDRVTFTIAPEPSVRVGSLQSGQVDIATTIRSQDEPSLNGNGFSLLVRTSPGTVVGIAPNIKKNDALKDPAVRKAIQLGIDREEISEVVLTPSYGVAKSVLGDTTPGFTDLSSRLEADPEQAIKLLEDAGWVAGSDGIREKNGERLSFTDIYFYQADVHEYVAQQLRKIGVELQLNPMDSAQYTQEFRTGKSDFVPAMTARADPDILRAAFSLNGLNFAYLSEGDPGVSELAALFAKIQQTIDQTEKYAAAQEAQEILIDNGYYFPFSQQVQVIGISDKVTGVVFDVDSRIVLYDASLAE
jgi:peptide/nickel transport system substrate-binding protein